MLIILLIIVIGIVSFLQVFRSKTSNASYYILAILWMLFPALRTEYVGTDTINYLGFSCNLRVDIMVRKSLRLNRDL